MRLDLASLIDPELWALVDESQEFYANRAAGRGPNSIEELRVVRAAAPAPATSDPPPSLEVAIVGNRTVPLRVHMPTGPPAGVYLEFHGGGFYMGSAAGSDVRNRRLSDVLGVVVVSVDYRLAPEHPWPAAAEDCETAAL